MEYLFTPEILIPVVVITGYVVAFALFKTCPKCKAVALRRDSEVREDRTYDLKCKKCGYTFKRRQPEGGWLKALRSRNQWDSLD